MSGLELNHPQAALNSLALQLVDYADARGLDPNVSLRGTQLFYDALLQDDSRISPLQVAKLQTNLLSLRQNDLSAELGTRLLHNNQQTVTNLLHNSDSLKNCLHNFCDWQNLLYPLVGIRAVESPLGVRLYLYDRYNLFCKSRQLWRLNQELVSIAIVSFCTHLGFQLTWELNLSSSEASNPLLLARRLGSGCKILNQATIANLFVDATYLTQSNLQASNSLYKKSLFELEKDSIQQTLLDQVRQLIYQHEQQNLSLIDCAEQLNMSPATLKRKLKAHNTSFKLLSDACRKQLLEEYQVDYHWSTQEVAEHWRMYDASNFKRAMKRWSLV